MSFLWLLFASLSVAGSLAYNLGMKFGSASANAFGFAFLLNVVVLSAQTIFCLVAKYGFKIDVTQGLNASTAKFAILSGCGAALIDVSYFLAVRYGSIVSSQIFWTVGGLIILAVFSILFLGEAMTATKALGIAFGIASVVLITK